MMKKKSLLSAAGLALMILCAGCSETEDTSTKKEEAPKVEYQVALDEKFATSQQRQVRVTTESTTEKDFEVITEKIMKDYEGQGLDSIHLYIHGLPENDSQEFGEYKAHSFIAFTQKGAAQTGLDKANTYKIELD